ncbi:hypothetical protein [Bacillus sp. 1P06AnD]|uniref:hypothetical protein n=1 Tax=Bacillus sp. 1P06AnD TaxID=3132208 RepID=UPI00399F3B1E
MDIILFLLRLFLGLVGALYIVSFVYSSAKPNGKKYKFILMGIISFGFSVTLSAMGY